MAARYPPASQSSESRQKNVRQKRECKIALNSRAPMLARQDVQHLVQSALAQSVHLRWKGITDIATQVSIIEKYLILKTSAMLHGVPLVSRVMCTWRDSVY